MRVRVNGGAGVAPNVSSKECGCETCKQPTRTFSECLTCNRTDERDVGAVMAAAAGALLGVLELYQQEEVG